MTLDKHGGLPFRHCGRPGRRQFTTKITFGLGGNAARNTRKEVNMPSYGGNFAAVVMAGMPALAKKSQRALRDFFASYYLKRAILG
jgi:hypothetical protein